MAAPLLTGLALLVSFAMHGSNLVLTAALANQLGADISLLDVLLVVPTIILIASLPISIGGWGVREAALAVGFSAWAARVGGGGNLAGHRARRPGVRASRRSCMELAPSCRARQPCCCGDTCPWSMSRSSAGA